MQVRVSPAANSLLAVLARDHGVTNKGVVGRLLTWFAAQDPAVRNAVLYPNGDPSGELVKLRLSQMAAAGDGLYTLGGKALSVDDAARLIHSLVDYMQQASRAVTVVAAAKKKG